MCKTCKKKVHKYYYTVVYNMLNGHHVTSANKTKTEEQNQSEKRTVRVQV